MWQRVVRPFYRRFNNLEISIKKHVCSECVSIRNSASVYKAKWLGLRDRESDIGIVLEQSSEERAMHPGKWRRQTNSIRALKISGISGLLQGKKLQKLFYLSTFKNIWKQKELNLLILFLTKLFKSCTELKILYFLWLTDLRDFFHVQLRHCSCFGIIGLRLV